MAKRWRRWMVSSFMCLADRGLFQFEKDFGEIKKPCHDEELARLLCS